MLRHCYEGHVGTNFTESVTQKKACASCPAHVQVCHQDQWAYVHPHCSELNEDVFCRGEMIHGRLVTICNVLPDALVKVSIKVIELIREVGRESLCCWIVSSDYLLALPHCVWGQACRRIVHAPQCKVSKNI